MTAGTAGTGIGPGQNLSLIFRENIYLFSFVSDWKSIPLMPNYLLAIFPRSPCVYWLGLLRAGKQFNPSNYPARTRKHCYIIQDATWTAAEWWDVWPSCWHCAFCIVKHPISGGGGGAVQQLQLKIFYTQMENNSLFRHLRGQKTLFFYPTVCVRWGIHGINPAVRSHRRKTLSSWV